MLKANKVVSIITPSFNRADIISDTANSIFSQTYPHWEWIIVDDGSTDNSINLLQQYIAKDSRVKVFQRDRLPKGAAVCRNIAVEKSSGDYLLFLDTDDVLASFCLEQRVAAAQQSPNCDFVAFPMLLFKSRLDDTGLLWNIEKEEDEINRLLFGDPLFQGTGTLWKKRSFVEIGMWNEKLFLWQDIELHLRAMLMGMKYEKRMDLMPDTFLRISDDSLSRVGFHSLPKLRSRASVLIDTANTIHKLRKEGVYGSGLKNMAADIIISAINSNYFDEASNLIKFTSSKNIFSKKEIDRLKQYQVTRKLKLYRIPVVRKIFVDRISSIVPKAESTLGKVKYLQPIKF